MKRSLLAAALLPASGALATNTFSEGTLGDFSDLFTSATDLGTLDPYSPTVVSGFGEEDNDYFDFTLQRPATLDALIDITNPADTSAGFRISTGLDANNGSVYNLGINEGATSLGTLGAGSYTVWNANGFDYTWQVTITPTPAVLQFHQESTGDILATLTLSTVPAGLGQVESLTFTPEGEAIFGFGPTYTGTFDSENGQFTDDGLGGLQGSLESLGIFYAAFQDDDVPASTVFSGPFDYLAIGAQSNVGGDSIELLPPPISGPYVPLAHVSGDWVLVPEPTSLSLLGLGGLIVHQRRRRA